MNKKLLFFVIAIIVVIVGSIAYVVWVPKRDAATTSQNPQVSEPSQASSPNPEAQPGAYVAYSPEAVASTAGTKLLFFHAPWCPQCREIEASINQEGLPAGVTVFKIDYDSNQQLRQQYEVTVQTTFVKVDDQGTKLDSYVAYQKPRFSSVERELLP